MKIALLTDLHIGKLSRSNLYIDPKTRVEQALRAVRIFAQDAELLVFLGDLADEGDELAYRQLRECLSDVLSPMRLLIGNHDNREAFMREFPEAPRDENGFIQSILETKTEGLFFLDTVGGEGEPGRYCAKRQEWLEDQLFRFQSKPAYIFMHHPPFPLGMRIDETLLQEHREFASILRRAGNVKHIFVGHAHRAASGRWNDVTWSSLHGTHIQTNLSFPGIRKSYWSGPAQIGILNIAGAQSTLHYHDFLESHHLIGVPTDLEL